MSTAHLIFLFVQTGGEFCYNDVYADAPMTEKMKNNKWVKGEKKLQFLICSSSYIFVFFRELKIFERNFERTF